MRLNNERALQWQNTHFVDIDKFLKHKFTLLSSDNIPPQIIAAATATATATFQPIYRVAIAQMRKNDEAHITCGKTTEHIGLDNILRKRERKRRRRGEQEAHRERFVWMKYYHGLIVCYCIHIVSAYDRAMRDKGNGNGKGIERVRCSSWRSEYFDFICVHFVRAGSFPNIEVWHFVYTQKWHNKFNWRII